jgi:bacterioferritin-associated ferredoxin
MIVCVCQRVSDRAIDAAIQAGATDLTSLSRTTGAGTDCGCCREELAARADAARRTAACSSPPCPGCPRAGTAPS